MIYVTGDTHGELSRFYERCMPGESKWTGDDKLIVCGDFGFVWYGRSDPAGYRSNQDALDSLAARPYEILFVDGNHENFDVLNEYPVVEKYGNEVHKIRDNIFHLQRGRIYTIEDRTFFTFGGAYSVDKYMRREGASWWRQELPTNEEYHLASDSLKNADYAVDYIISHTAPQTIIRMMNNVPHPADSELTGFFDWVWHETKFRKWFFGHWHGDSEIAEKARLLWFDVERIE